MTTAKQRISDQHRESTPKRIAYKKQYRKVHPKLYTDASRRGHLKRTFGLTEDEYDTLLKKQGGGCGICGSRVDSRPGYKLAVDHDHNTGKIRGVLCSKCNIGLGWFDDNLKLLKAACGYLR
jgi:hypothetical protein